MVVMSGGHAGLHSSWPLLAAAPDRCWRAGPAHRSGAGAGPASAVGRWSSRHAGPGRRAAGTSATAGRAPAATVAAAGPGARRHCRVRAGPRPCRCPSYWAHPGRAAAFPAAELAWMAVSPGRAGRRWPPAPPRWCAGSNSRRGSCAMRPGWAAWPAPSWPSSSAARLAGCDRRAGPRNLFQARRRSTSAGLAVMAIALAAGLAGRPGTRRRRTACGGAVPRRRQLTRARCRLDPPPGAALRGRRWRPWPPPGRPGSNWSPAACCRARRILGPARRGVLGAGPPLVFAPLGRRVSGTFYSRARRREVGYTIAWPPGHRPGAGCR